MIAYQLITNASGVTCCKVQPPHNIYQLAKFQKRSKKLKKVEVKQPELPLKPALQNYPPIPEKKNIFKKAMNYLRKFIP
jgi:hypothetical protein